MLQLKLNSLRKKLSRKPKLKLKLQRKNCKRPRIKLLLML